MLIENFIADFIQQLELGDQSIDISNSTIFQDLDDWDSLTALMVLDMIDDKYEVSLTGDELKECVTIDDLYNLILQKK